VIGGAMVAVATVILYATRDARNPSSAPSPGTTAEPAATAATALEAALGDSVVIGPGSDAGTPVRGKAARAVSADAVALLQLSIAKPAVAAGDTVHVRLDAFDDGGLRVVTHQIVWTTSNPRVVHFTSPGELVAVKEGSATITVAAGSATTSLPMTVGARGIGVRTPARKR
jgi:hypothetical protein